MDTNNDQEIQVSEAEAIDNLRIGKYPDTFLISDIGELRQFKHLRRLEIFHNSNLRRVDDLGVGLDSLKYLHFDFCVNLKHIDLSNLPPMEVLRIEDMQDIEYLNVQNGSTPSQTFSLFYSEYIVYACVDSILSEYSEVNRHMATQSPSLNCALGVEAEDVVEPVSFYPNPTNGILNFICEKPIDKIVVFGTDAKQLLVVEQPISQIDLSLLPKGVYFLQVFMQDGILNKKVLLQ